jgi:hypothetical protein
LSSDTEYQLTTDNNQYVTQVAIEDEQEYIVGKIDRKTISTTIRAELFVTPELSFQYYGNPYATVGKYDNFRKVADSNSKDLNERYANLQLITNDEGETLLMDGSDFVRNLTTRSPDFNFQEFRSNFVARWEYKTGSTIYFVWTNTRSRYESKYNSSVFESFKGISNVKAQNAFMLKVSFWFSI